MKKNILVLCTGNSCRSQIAEGYLKVQLKEVANVYSAGIETHGVNPRVIQVMKEDGVDVSMQTSNLVSEYKHIDFDFIITVCDHARENCPYFPSKATRIHMNFPDPARVSGSEEEIMLEFRKVRDLIQSYCIAFVQTHFCT